MSHQKLISLSIFLFYWNGYGKIISDIETKIVSIVVRKLTV